MMAALKKNGLELDTRRLHEAHAARLRACHRGRILSAAIRNRHFVVRHAIDPAGIHGPALVDELVDFTLRAKPLLDWGRAIEGKARGGLEFDRCDRDDHFR